MQQPARDFSAVHRAPTDGDRRYTPRMHRSRVYALIVDVPRESAPAAAAVWSAALGTTGRQDAAEPEFTDLPVVVPDLPVASDPELFASTARRWD